MLKARTREGEQTLLAPVAGIVKLDAFFFTRRGYLKSVVSGCNRR